MEFGFISILGIFAVLLIIPTFILLAVFMFKFIKTHLTMLAYLTVLYIFYLINNLLQASQFFAQTEEIAELFFKITECAKLLMLLSLILIFEMYYSNTQFSYRQTISTVLAFSIIVGLISTPELNTQAISTGFLVSLQRLSLLMILEVIYILFTTTFIIIMLIRSIKSAWSSKQKILIIALLIGSIIGVLFPSIPTVFVEQSPVPEQFNYFTMQFFQTITQNIGILIIGIAFLSVSKNPWLLQRQKVYFLIVYSHDGINLYSRLFSKEINPDDAVLLSGAFSAVSSLIKESTNTTGKVKAILLEGKELRLITRRGFICALLVEYSTQASKWAQNKFSSEFERTYKDKLDNFDGEISAFDSADKIADKYFT
ncbi:MAG: hypothetical protein ACFFBP_10345 [Promethearchaeota archaeon]